MNKKNIRYSTDVDLKEILSWLKKQHLEGIHETFYCNKNLTIDSHNEKELIVYIDSITNKAIAYQWGGLITPGILEVKASYRRQGIGKELVKYRIDEAQKNNNCLLEIQCKPTTSIPFWLSMGFKLYGKDNKAYQLLSKKHELPPNGIPIKVKIDFYPEQRLWNNDTPPIKTFTPDAVKINSDGIYLSERISFFNHLPSHLNDTVIDINIDNKQIYSNKAKYKEAQELGVCRDGRAFYLDKIELDI